MLAWFFLGLVLARMSLFRAGLGQHWTKFSLDALLFGFSLVSRCVCVVSSCLVCLVGHADEGRLRREEWFHGARGCLSRVLYSNFQRVSLLFYNVHTAGLEK